MWWWMQLYLLDFNHQHICFCACDWKLTVKHLIIDQQLTETFGNKLVINRLVLSVNTITIVGNVYLTIRYVSCHNKKVSSQIHLQHMRREFQVNPDLKSIFYLQICFIYKPRNLYFHRPERNFPQMRDALMPLSVRECDSILNVYVGCFIIFLSFKFCFKWIWTKRGRKGTGFSN